MRKILLATVALAALSSAASAADMAARPYSKVAPIIPVLYDWSGFYLGVNGGYGTSHKCWDFVSPGGTFVAAEGCHDATGGTAGGQIGYRWQSSSWVFGLEAQGNWADFSGSNVSAAFPRFSNHTKVDAFGLFTGQIGYAWNNALLYVKGGAGLTSNRYRTTFTATGVQPDNAVDSTRWGGTVGVGVEYGFAPNWSVALEYDHMFMQDKTYGFTNNGVLFTAGTLFGTDRIRQDVDLVTARLNYRWGAPIVSRY